MRPPRPSLSLVRGPPVPHASRSGGGQTWRWVGGFWLTGWLVAGRAERVTSPPRLRRCPPEVGFLLEVVQKAGTRPPLPRFARRCPPGLGGFLARIWASRFASGALMKLTAALGAPCRKTPTSKKPPVSPHSGGQRRRRGGLVTHSAKPTTRSPPFRGAAPKARGACPRTLRNCHNARATNRAPDARSAPPPETVGRDTGGPRTTEREGRGGRAISRPRRPSRCGARTRRGGRPRRRVRAPRRRTGSGCSGAGCSRCNRGSIRSRSAP